MSSPHRPSGRTTIARAPTRIDFGGGWTDVPPYSDELGGYVCNLAIARYATVTVVRAGTGPESDESREPDHLITRAVAQRFRVADARVSVHSDFPIGAGLGGSSAATVATVAAFAAMRGESMLPTAMAELSREIETVDLGIAGGRQDHYAAAYGGALGLRFVPGRVEVRQIALGMKTRLELERRCVIVYTGQSRMSSETIRTVLTDYRNRVPTVLYALRRSRELAEQMADALAKGDVERLAALVGEQWAHQRSLNPAIPTPLIDEIVTRCHDAGAAGAKALGASGGGCVLLIAKSDRVGQVREAAAELGELVPFKIAHDGVELCQ